MMAPKLLSETMHDGSRCFLRFPQTTAPFRLLVHVFALPGAFPTGYIPSFDQVWFDFRYEGHSF